MSDPSFQLLSLLPEMKMEVVQRLSPASLSLYALTSKENFDHFSHRIIAYDEIIMDAATTGSWAQFIWALREKFGVCSQPASTWDQSGLTRNQEEKSRTIAFRATCLAARRGHASFVASSKALLGLDRNWLAPVDLKAPSEQPLVCAAQSGKLEVISELLPDEMSESAKHQVLLGAALGGHLQLLRDERFKPSWPLKNPELIYIYRAAISSLQAEVVRFVRTEVRPHNCSLPHPSLPHSPPNLSPSLSSSARPRQVPAL